MRFEPASWDEGAQRVSSELTAFESAARQAIEATAFGDGRSATDAAIAAALQRVQATAAGAVEEISRAVQADSQLMQETAAAYRDVEDQATKLIAQLRM